MCVIIGILQGLVWCVSGPAPPNAFPQANVIPLVPRVADSAGHAVAPTADYVRPTLTARQNERPATPDGAHAVISARITPSCYSRLAIAQLTADVPGRLFLYTPADAGALVEELSERPSDQ